MFDYVIASLSPEVATEIVILTPPEANQYNVLKEQLIQRTAVSEQRRLQQLLGSEELGDGKPSQFLRRLQQLAGDTVRNDGAFLRQLFLQRLPPMVLASASDTTQWLTLLTGLWKQLPPTFQLLSPPTYQQLVHHPLI